MVLAICVLACVTDLRTRRIPNLLTLGGAVLALLYILSIDGWRAVLSVSILGWAAGLAVFLPFYLLGGLGAGDVKLVACIGAWLGPVLALWTGLYAALAGGVMAVVLALATGHLASALRNVYVLVMHFRTEGVRPHPSLTLERSAGPRLPYAVPIAAGAIAAIWLH
jgi:prepilin peptidase CpaA